MKKTLCLLLCAAALLSVLTFPMKAGAVCFTAVNDTLCELSDSTMPASVGGEMYVPYTAFVNTSLGVGYFYEKRERQLTLYRSGASITFDLSTGIATDQSGNEYAEQAVFRNTRIYVPAQFVCGVLGLGYAYMSGAEPAPILRITSSNAYLDTASFPGAAKYLMNTYLAAYQGVSPEPEPPTPPATDPAPETPTQPQPETPSTQTKPDPEPTTPPQVKPEPETEPEKPEVKPGEIEIFISFESLSDHTGELLDELDRYGCRATFFLTAEDIEANADTVRRIVGSGYGVGIKCTGEEDYARASKLLFNAARTSTVLVTVPADADAQPLLDGGLILWDNPDGDGVFSSESLTFSSFTARIDEDRKRADVRFDCSETLTEKLPSVLSSLTARGYNIKRITETEIPYSNR